VTTIVKLSLNVVSIRLTLIVASPSLKAVTMPSLSTFKTDSLSLVKLTSFLVALLGVTS